MEWAIVERGAWFELRDHEVLFDTFATRAEAEKKLAELVRDEEISEYVSGELRALARRVSERYNINLSAARKRIREEVR